MLNNKHTNKIIEIATFILFFLFVGVFILEYLSFSNRVYEIRDVSALTELTDIKTKWVDDNQYGVGGYDLIEWKISRIESTSEDLVFYAVHQSVEVYINEQLVYSVWPSEKNLFGKTPGYFWNSIPLYYGDEGKTLTIKLIPAYESGKGNIPVVYLGDKLDFILGKIKGNVMIVIIAFVSIMLGIVFHAWCFAEKKRNRMDQGIYHIGSFSIFMGTWKLGDVDTSAIIPETAQAISLIPLLSLFLVSIPALMFIRDFFGEKHKKFYNYVIIIGIVAYYISFILQIFNIKDFRETLFLAHVLFYTIIVTCGFDMFREVRQNGWTINLKIAVFCLLACFAGMVVDMSVFYIYSASVSTGFGMLGFLSYVIVMGVYRVKESMRLIEEGKQAERYQDMAYHDQLTGVFSRVAYAERISKESFEKYGSVIFMLDLNNLKRCNDTLGHEAGDRYIVTAAEIIKGVFDSKGDCYRLGGDEFCVLLRDFSDKQCQNFISEIRAREEKHMEENPESYPVSIAIGYAIYDYKEDYTINDTVRRADHMMYKNKEKLKQE